MMLQNTKEWLEFRKNRIGASEANIIMGVSKFSTPNELLRHKLHPDSKEKKDNTFITDKGHRLEEKIRAYIELELEMDFPAIVAVSEQYPFIMASLDGFNDKNKFVLECKYVGAADFEKVKSGNYLEQYYPQLQQQMFVTNSSKNFLAVAMEDKEKNLHYEYIAVARDDEYIKNELLPSLLDFYEKMNIGGKLKLTKKDVYDQSDDVNLKDLLSEYSVLIDEEKNIKKKIADYKDEIFKVIKHNNVICGNAKIQEIAVKGRETFDYKKYFKGQEIPEEFLKVGKPTTARKIMI